MRPFALSLLALFLLAPAVASAQDPSGPMGVYDAGKGRRVGALLGYANGITSESMMIMIATSAGTAIVHAQPQDRWFNGDYVLYDEVGPSGEIFYRDNSCEGTAYGEINPNTESWVSTYPGSTAQIGANSYQSDGYRELYRPAGPPERWRIHRTFKPPPWGNGCEPTDFPGAFKDIVPLEVVADLSDIEFPLEIVPEGEWLALVALPGGPMWLGVAGLMVGYRLARRRSSDKREPD